MLGSFRVVSPRRARERKPDVFLYYLNPNRTCALTEQVTRRPRMRHRSGRLVSLVILIRVLIIITLNPPRKQSQAKHHEIIGNDIFSAGHAASSRALSDAKIAQLQGHDVFSDSPNAFVPGKQVSHAKLQRDYRGSDVFSDVAEPRRPGTALSTAKANDMRGLRISSPMGPRGRRGRCRRRGPRRWRR